MIYDFKFSMGSFSCDDFTRKQASILQSVKCATHASITLIRSGASANCLKQSSDQLVATGPRLDDPKKNK